MKDRGEEPSSTSSEVDLGHHFLFLCRYGVGGGLW